MIDGSPTLSRVRVDTVFVVLIGLRDLRFIWESAHERWAKNLRRLFYQMNQAVQAVKKKGQTHLSAQRIQYWQHRYRRILKAGF